MRRRVLLALVMMLCCGAVAAEPLENLTQARVPAEEQGGEAQQKALRAGLERVLVRLTGILDVAGREEVEEILDQPDRYVQQYRYESSRGGRLFLVARFDGGTLREELVRRGIAIWQAERPPVLAWVAYNDGGARHLIGGDDGLQVQNRLRRTTRDVGVPLLFPLLDLEDQQVIRFVDVAGGFTEPVLSASERYETPLVLAGRVRERNGRWFGRWTLFRDGEGSSWEATGDRLEPVLEDMAHGLARRLREDYAVLPRLGSSEALPVRVVGLGSLAAYARAERILARIAGVTDVRLDRIEGDGARFRLFVNVDEDRVLRELDRASSLERVEDWVPEAPDREAEVPAAPRLEGENGSGAEEDVGGGAITAPAVGVAPPREESGPEYGSGYGSTPEVLGSGSAPYAVTGATPTRTTPTDPVYRLAR